MKIIRLVWFVGFVVSLSQSVILSQTRDESRDVIESLKGKLPAAPALATDELSKLMCKVAETERLDALEVLIKALAFNFPEWGKFQHGTRDPAGMIPAIALIKLHYGEPACPLLCYAGVTTNDQWMRERCAAAIRAIASKAEIERLTVAFSLDDRTNARVQPFADLLFADVPRVNLYNPTTAQKGG